jgi:hypothetical protein
LSRSESFSRITFIDLRGRPPSPSRGAYLKAGGGGGAPVDFEADVIRIHHEVDHPPALRETLLFAHQQHRQLADRAQDLGEARVVAAAEEDDLAGRELLRQRGVEKDHAAPLYDLLFEPLEEGGSEEVRAVDAEAVGLGMAGEGAVRPLDELREVVQERGLDGVFVHRHRRRSGGGRGQRRQQSQQSQQDAGGHVFHHVQLRLKDALGSTRLGRSPNSVVPNST